MNTDTSSILGMAVILILVLSFVLGLFEVVARTSCSSYSERYNIATDYDTFDGCYVEASTGWVPKQAHSASVIRKLNAESQ